MKKLIKTNMPSKFRTFGLVICGTVSLAVMNSHAVAGYGVDTTLVELHETDDRTSTGGTHKIDWGTCPCVQAGAAWSRVHGITSNTNTFPYRLESTEQTYVGANTRSTNNAIAVLNGVATTIGEIDVFILSEQGELHCSAYTLLQQESGTSKHHITDTGQAVTDCRTGLYKMADQILIN